MTPTVGFRAARESVVDDAAANTPMGESQMRTIRALTETAVRVFVDWLYETGPDPNLVTRERLLAEYRAWRQERADGG